MKDVRMMLKRTLEAADYLIRAADTQDSAECQRLKSIAEGLLGEAEQAGESESEYARTREPPC